MATRPTPKPKRQEHGLVKVREQYVGGYVETWECRCCGGKITRTPGRRG